MKLALIIIILIILVISYICFKMTFARTNKTLQLPDNECYKKYQNDIEIAKKD